MDPTKKGNGTPDQERAETKILKTGKAYQSPESWANRNHPGPGTAIIPLTQGRFAFDGSEPFRDPRIAGYLQFLARELSDDGVRAFLRARYAYSVFQRLGTPESRRYAWSAIQLLCRLSAKNRHGGIAVTPENRVLGQRGKSDSEESWR